MRVEEQFPVVGRRGKRLGELVEAAVVELGGDFDHARHGTVMPPRMLWSNPPAPRQEKFRAPVALASRMAASSGAPAKSRAESVAPKASPQPVGSPSPATNGAGIRAVWIGRRVWSIPLPNCTGSDGADR